MVSSQLLRKILKNVGSLGFMTPYFSLFFNGAGLFVSFTLHRGQTRPEDFMGFKLKNTLKVALLAILFSPAAHSDLPAMTAGQQLEFKRDIQVCSYCHSPVGIAEYGAARLEGQPTGYLEAQINSFISHKRNNPLARDLMWGTFDRMDPKLIPYFAEYFSKQEIKSNLKAKPVLVAQGKDIYLNGIPSKNIKACQLCHGEDAKGHGTTPRLASQEKSYVIDQFLDWQNNYRNYSSTMVEISKALDEQEILAVSEYVSSL